MMNEAAVFSRLNQLQNDLSIRFALEEEIARLPRDLKVKQELLDTINLDYIDEHTRSEAAKVELKNLGYRRRCPSPDKSERNMELSPASSKRGERDQRCRSERAEPVETASRQREAGRSKSDYRERGS